MHGAICFNNIIQSLPAGISVLSSAALYGRGVFTTVAVYRKQPFLWPAHERRLRRDAAKINFDIGAVDFDLVREKLGELVSFNKVEIGRARVTIFDGGSGALWMSDEPPQISTLITTADARPQFQNDLRLVALVNDFTINRNSILAGVKSCNYLDNLLTLEHTRSRKFDEALRFNEGGSIVSAATANVFWIKDETLFTPNLFTGAIDGTTRGFVIDLWREIGGETIESGDGIDPLLDADEIFLTSAGIGIAGARSFYFHSTAPDLPENRLTVRLQKLFREKVF